VADVRLAHQQHHCSNCIRCAIFYQVDRLPAIIKLSDIACTYCLLWYVLSTYLVCTSRVPHADEPRLVHALHLTRSTKCAYVDDNPWLSGEFDHGTSQCPQQGVFAQFLAMWVGSAQINDKVRITLSPFSVYAYPVVTNPAYASLPQPRTHVRLFRLPSRLALPRPCRSGADSTAHQSEELRHATLLLFSELPPA
jgi:hypothetical protein